MSGKEESASKKTKADEETKSEVPKASVKKDKKEKKSTKPKAEKKAKTQKKSVKNSKTSTKTKTTTKKENTKKTKKTTESKQYLDSNSDLTGFERYVFEAISAKATEDKPLIGINSISGYIRQYIPDVKVGLIPRYTRSALTKLADRGILKRKNDSYGIAKKGKKLNVIIPKRETIRTPSVKGDKRAQTEEKTEQFCYITSRGRVSVKNVFV